MQLLFGSVISYWRNVFVLFSTFSKCSFSSKFSHIWSFIVSHWRVLDFLHFSMSVFALNWIYETSALCSVSFGFFEPPHKALTALQKLLLPSFSALAINFDCLIFSDRFMDLFIPLWRKCLWGCISQITMGRISGWSLQLAFYDRQRRKWMPTRRRKIHCSTNWLEIKTSSKNWDCQ